ncbi:MAG: beta-lactamase family protein [Lachnospiraceae bacterium]|nr:beta-lactamase family protein [Lachnospiraceae bacterium]
MNTEKIIGYIDTVPGMGVPGADVCIYKDHKEVLRYMTGYADSKHTVPVSNSTQYLVFSMTKLQTMTAVMQLVEKGDISLEDEVAKFLPAYGELYVEDENGEFVKSGIRCRKAKTKLLLKHLVSMQSGLDYNLERPGIKRVLAEKGLQATTREIVDSFTESPLKFEPGGHFMYSLSHDVVAAIIEVVSGMSFGDYLKKNVWEPLGMKRTYFAGPMNDDVPNLAEQFIQNQDGEIVPMEASDCYQLSDKYESGGAGLISCTEDYIKLADMLACGGVSADGARGLKSEPIETMRTNLLSEAGRADIASTMGRTAYGYGCGVQIFMEPDLVSSPAIPGIFGWDGAAGGCLIADPVNHISLVYLQHVRSMGRAYSEIHPTLRDLLYSE